MGEAAAHRRKRTIGAAIWALILLAALVVGLVYSESAQSYRRISNLSLNELQVCRDGFRFQLGIETSGAPFAADFQGAWRQPFPTQVDPVPPGSIASARTLTLNTRPVTFIGEDGFALQDNRTGVFTIRPTVTLNAGELIEARFKESNNVSQQVLQVRDVQGVEDCLLPTLPSSARMVGKGSLTDPSTGTTASYAYIASCDPASTTAGPFEVRYGTHRFRLTTVHGVSCANYANVTTPAAGFDRQTGTGTGTLDGVPGAYFEWTFVDGGPGGVSDSAALTIRVAGSAPQFQSFPPPDPTTGLQRFALTNPPGKFPGSTQATGYNTAQAPLPTATAR